MTGADPDHSCGGRNGHRRVPAAWNCTGSWSSLSTPVARILSVVFIEFWRGVPLITVLFMASVMLPLFLPEGVNFNNLLRASTV